VIVDGGHTKEMRDLLPGDRVLASSSTDVHAQLLYSPIVSFLDRRPNATRTFYVIGTDGQHNITLTAAHLIFVTDCVRRPRKSGQEETSQGTKYFGSMWQRRGPEEGMRTVFATEVQPGQCVFTTSGRSKSRPRLSVVTFVEEQRSTGLYAPLTQHGSIVVNSVLASCYAAVDSHYLSHWVLAPLRLVYRIIGPSQVQIDGLHWYPWILQRLGKVLLGTGHFHPWGFDQ
ncbi:hypothetical protein XENOCAPTIV_010362, partial [Xenoophorus captivus]